MNSIEIFLPFGEEDVDKKNYSASILMLCSANGLLSDEKSKYIQGVCAEIFIETLEQFTERKSGSVQTENAKHIYESVFYRADVYLLSLGSLAAAVKSVVSEDFAEILQKGSSLVLDKFNTAQRYSMLARKNALKTASKEYKYACFYAFDKFKRSYSARFFAKSIITEIEYPLLYGEPEYSGVLYMANYYKSLYAENLFLSLFRKSDVHKLLIAYGEMFCSRYTDLLENYCRVAVNNFFASLLLNKNGTNILINESEITRLSSLLCSKSREDIEKQLLTSFYKEITSHEIRLYLRKYIDIFISELYSHLENGTLRRFIVACE